MCHLPLLAPVFGIVLFWVCPLSLAAPAYAIIVALSVLLYVLTLRVMRSPGRTGAEALKLGTGKVLALDPKGATIRISGETWQAVSAAPLRPGERVRVIGRRGMTLRVQPVGDDPRCEDEPGALARARR